jgi:uncharacterized membrane protein
MFELLTLISAIIFILLDSIYLNFIKTFFKKQIETIQGTKLIVNYVGAAICYLFLIFGLNYFIIKPNSSVKDAFLFGLIIYGVYETTNYTLFTKWSILTVFIDTLWGGTLFALTTYIIKNIRKLIS